MKKNGGHIYSLWIRVLAWILYFVFAVLAVGSALSAAFMFNMGIYTMSKDAVRDELLTERLEEDCIDVIHYYLNGVYDIPELFRYRNFLFEIINEDGVVVEGNYAGQDYLYSCTLEYNPVDFIGAELYEAYDIILEGESYPRNEHPFKVTGYIPVTMEQTDIISITAQIIELGFSLKYTVWVILFVSALLSLVMFIFLLCAAGHRRGFEGIVLGPLDRIPLDVVAAGIVIFNLIAIAVILNLYSYGLQLFLALLLCVLDFGLVNGFFVSLAARLKAGGVLKNTLIWRVISCFFRIMKKTFSLISKLIESIPLMWKTILCMGAAFLWGVILIFIAVIRPWGAILLWGFSWFVLFVFSVYLSMSLIKIKLGGERLAAGKLDEKINTEHMFADFRQHADTLNRIGDGMTLAVEERLKSERFRTELITNVSHDLKTPLTSIINYVDLLKKEEPENQKIKEYIAVLDRQASRLKKLTEDLVEASKASTGNIQVELSVCELGELVMQTAGEYGERLSAAGLEPIIKKPDEPVKIMADGRLLWRVIDNLLNNIYKYAQPGTRVYINLEKKGDKAEITFKNTSKYALNISSDELMERFVRGDASRHTEGSGLGLSIARSLVELQKGKMGITIDGDLFKVTLVFDVIE